MSSEPIHAIRIAALLCLAETLSMTGFAAYPAFLPALRTAWGLSGAQAGFIGGAFFCGYMLAVPLLAGVTDRIDARGVHAFSCALAASVLGNEAAGRFGRARWRCSPRACCAGSRAFPPPCRGG